MKISELFYTLQGEGFFSGYPCFFIRTSGCNLRCSWCFHGNTLIDTPSGRKKIKDLEIGDKVLSLNPKTKKLEETVVTNNISRQVSNNDVLHVRTKSHDFYVTKEHPFYIKNKGFKKVSDLNVGDIITSANDRQLNSFRMKKHNPMFDEDIKSKVSKTSKEGYLSGRLKSYERSDTLKKFHSERMKKHNPMFNTESHKKSCENRFGKKSKLEERYEDIFNYHEMPIKYTGNNKFSVGGSGDRYNFPFR